MNKNVLITGSSRGIGAATALAFAKQGDNVAINYRFDKEGAEDICRQVRALGVKSEVYQANVGDRDDVERMFTKFFEDFGTIDVLVNNAGGAGKIPEGRFEDMPLDYWDDCIALNLNAAAYCSSYEAGYDLPWWKYFDEASEQIPLLSHLAPGGPYSLKDLDLAGGLPALLKELLPELKGDCLTVTGHTLEENIQNAVVYNPEVIRSLDNPVMREPGIGVLYGNLAPEGAIIKIAAVPEHLMKFTGKARVFDELHAALDALRAGEICPGDAIIIRFLGLRARFGTTAYTVFAPAHNPVYIRTMKDMRKRFPDLLQIGYFETTFHATIPEKRVLYGVPYEWKESYGIRRYGFHGSSHSYMAWKMGQEAPEIQRFISFHLGGSSSVCAISEGKSVASSMGATPQSGLMQNNRVGDIDLYSLPGLIDACREEAEGEKSEGWKEALTVLSTKGGLLGVSGVSNDMREIERAALEGNERAKLTLDAYVDNLVGYAGMFDAYLKGAEALVFTGGIGMGSATLRKRVCEELAYKGIVLDEQANENKKEGLISKPESKIAVYVWQTNEELMVMRQCLAFIGKKS